jgi:hypothetical protein
MAVSEVASTSPAKQREGWDQELNRNVDMPISLSVLNETMCTLASGVPRQQAVPATDHPQYFGRAVIQIGNVGLVDRESAEIAKDSVACQRQR